MNSLDSAELLDGQAAKSSYCSWPHITISTRCCTPRTQCAAKQAKQEPRRTLGFCSAASATTALGGGLAAGCSTAGAAGLASVAPAPAGVGWPTAPGLSPATTETLGAAAACGFSPSPNAAATAALLSGLAAALFPSAGLAATVAALSAVGGAGAAAASGAAATAALGCGAAVLSSALAAGAGAAATAVAGATLSALGGAGALAAATASVAACCASTASASAPAGTTSTSELSSAAGVLWPSVGAVDNGQRRGERAQQAGAGARTVGARNGRPGPGCPTWRQQQTLSHGYARQERRGCSGPGLLATPASLQDGGPTACVARDPPRGAAGQCNCAIYVYI